MNQTISLNDELFQSFKHQKESFLKHTCPSKQERLVRLGKLKQLLLSNKDDIIQSIAADFTHRSDHETRLLELFPSLESIHYASKHLGQWMKPQPKSVSFWFQPATAKIMVQPLGVVGIVVPWNYPLFLAVSPLVSAIAAGNKAMIKMSEHSPAFSRVFTRAIAEYFADDEVCVVNGDATVAEAFCRLPFDHLFFTGSTSVGKQVMKAASENLTPVTLELGGKSPAVVDEGYKVDDAAKSIVWGKLCNAGQTCIAPDYVCVHSSQLEQFVASCKKWAQYYYPQWSGDDYTAIINEDQRARLKSVLRDAQERGASVSLTVADPDASAYKIPLYLLHNVNEGMRVMQEEIFGPLLPIVTYESIEEVCEWINKNERPLSMYLFSRNKQWLNTMTCSTVSGGVCVNDTLLHVAQESLPFGGVGASGIGHCHGEFGFRRFSKEKPIFHQSGINASRLIKPPYTRLTDYVLRLMLRC